MTRLSRWNPTPSVKGSRPPSEPGGTAAPPGDGDAQVACAMPRPSPLAAEQREYPNRNDGLMEEVNDPATTAVRNEKGGAAQSGRGPGLARRHLKAGTAY